MQTVPLSVQPACTLTGTQVFLPVSAPFWFKWDIEVLQLLRLMALISRASCFVCFNQIGCAVSQGG